MRFIDNQMIFWSTLLLLLLSGCANASTQRSITHASITPTPTFLLTPTSTPLPFLPHDHDPFQATFIETAPLTTCPPSSRPTDLCWNVSGTGISIPYGPITFTSFDINFLVAGNQDQDHCEPSTRQGSITIGKDTLRFTASGTGCEHLVHFVYQVTGGTGIFRHAHGKGAISIPISNPTNPPPQLLEFWTGTLRP